MGIHGIYKEIGSGQRIALSKLAVDKFEETGRPLRIAIDVSIWLFQIQAGKGGTNPAPRTFYYRLLRLIALCIHPIFVFDGPNKPPFKRGKKTGGHVSSVPDFLAKQLIKQFGFPIHYAPGEAEAECALLQREGIVDAVLSEDVDTLMFGSGITIRNWSPEPGTSGKTPTHVNVYDAERTRSSGIDPEGMILVALMSGGDYVPKGIPNCGPKIACEAARAGFGKDLCRLKKSDQAGIREWRERLQHELKTNESKFFATKHGAIKIPDDFPRLDILTYYTNPVVSNKASLDNLRRSMTWDKEIDFPGLRTFTHDAFDWIKLEGAKHFIRCLAPAMLVRGLRMRAMQDRFISDNLEAIREDESLLVKGIHSRRQHPITDNTNELRVSYTPIELVKIDLSKEEPDDFESTDAGTDTADPAEPDLDILEFGDDEDGTEPKKRGPTKFDPLKPARAWVMETFVKVGVPLTAEEWEASQRMPKRAATSKGANKIASKAKGSKKTGTTKAAKATDAASQASIIQFGRITKPIAKKSQPVSKPQTSLSQPSKPAQQPQRSNFIDLLSSSPPKPTSTVSAQRPRENSLSPIRELPSSVTKRRKRGLLARSHTSPADLSSPLARPITPPPNAIPTLNLLTSPAIPSPSELPAKKARTRSVRDVPEPRVRRQKSVTASPSKGKQTTLDAWTLSSPAATPTKARTANVPTASKAPLLAPPRFQKTLDSGIDILDLTASPPKPVSKPRPATATAITTNSTLPNATAKARRTQTDPFEPRPPLQSLCSNTSFSSITSSASHTSTSTPAPGPNDPSKPTRPTRRAAPRLDNPSSKTPPPEIATLDLTLDLSPPARPLPKLPLTATAAPSTSANSFDPTTSTLGRTRPASPPPPQKQNEDKAPWKRHRAARTQRKRVIQLRASGVGTWEFADASSTSSNSSSPVSVSRGGDEMRTTTERGGRAREARGGGKTVVRNGKERRRWRESQVAVLDLVGD
ncbi:uncharacterized protein EI97DRAFT_432964, partial [Westerdykella ornata]